MSNKESIIKLLKVLKHYRNAIIFIIICLIITTILNLCMPLITKDIMDKGFIGSNKKVLIELVFLDFLFQLVNSIVAIVKEKKRVYISGRVQKDFYLQAFKHLTKIRMKYFNNINYSELLSRLDVDISNMVRITDESLFFAFTEVFSLIGGIIGLCMISTKLTLMVIVFMPVKYIVVKWFAKKKNNEMEVYIEQNRRYAKWFGDSIGGIKEIRLFGISNVKEKECDKLQEKVIKHKNILGLLEKYNIVTDTMITQILILCIYIIGADMFFKFNLTVGSIFAFITYVSYVTEPISSILNIGYMFSGIIPSTKRYYEFIELDEEDDIGRKECSLLGKNIEIKNVKFSYEGKSTILDGVNMTIKAGSKVALIGRNGSGKSTIIELLLRLYTVNEGEICISGESIYNYNIFDYRNEIAVVSQQVYLFNKSIRENIKLYKDIDDNVIMEAIKDSGLTDLVKEKSLDYIVGENGSMLSGGQKQKIALARALVHNKPLFIFDEATSNSDIYSEMKINQLMQSKLKNKTIILVTHKSEILKDVDSIILLKAGKIHCCGTYDELIKKSLEFKDMMNGHKMVI